MIVKGFNYTQLKTRRDKLTTALHDNYLDAVVSGPTLHSIADTVMETLPVSCSSSAIFDSVRLLAGTQLTYRVIKEFSWRMAGNVDRLNVGITVLPWTQQTEDEIVPVLIENIQHARRRQDFGFTLSCRVLAGTPCPMLFTQFFSANSCRAIARVIGFSNNSSGPHQYSGLGLHFHNLMFFAHIDAAESRSQPVFHKVSVSSGMLRQNKLLLDVRCRNKPCPQNFSHPCANCHVGYTDCRYGVHRTTYVARYCRNCDSESYFDPEHPNIVCMKCAKSI